MSTTVGHLLGGALLGRVIARRRAARAAATAAPDRARELPWCAIVALASALPDAELVLAPLLGAETFVAVHRTWSHSLLVLVPVAVGLGLVLRRRLAPDAPRGPLIGAVLAGFVLHLAQDALNGGVGVMPLYPLSGAHLAAPLRVLPILGNGRFGEPALGRSLLVIGLEVALFAPWLAAPRRGRIGRLVAAAVSLAALATSIALRGGLALFDR